MKASLGQHFLIDSPTLSTIVQVSEVSSNDFVLEIGPGLGYLTEKLLATNCQVLAVELDRVLVQHLQTKVAPQYPNLEIVHGDGRLITGEFLANKFRDSQAKTLSIVANVPYQASKDLVNLWFDYSDILPINRIVLLVQKEFAKKLLAEPGDSAWQQLSLRRKLRYHCEAITEVPPEFFDPPPQVMSEVIVLDSNDSVGFNESQIAEIEKISRLLFNNKRKTLQAIFSTNNNLSCSDHSLLPKRPQELTLEEILTICIELR